jgi:glycosyltransferase involved in cell wall biosynthesis
MSYLSLWTFSFLPQDGIGPAQTCLNILENLSTEAISPILFTPRATVEVSPKVTVRETLPPLLRRAPYKAMRRIGYWTLSRAYERALETMDPKTSIAYFWPDPPTSLILKAKARGIVTVREMINSTRGSAKRILDEVYRSHGVPPTHGISDASVRLEDEQLRLYDYIFTPIQVEPGVLAAGVDPARIVPSSFGWDPKRFPKVDAPGHLTEMTALFVGTVCFRKGVPELLRAWKQSRINGRLILVGRIAKEMKSFLETYTSDTSITFIEFTNSLAKFYHEASFFVFPTFEEGSPQVTFEAAGCGRPIITTPMGAGRLIKDGINGVVVPPGDVDALATAMSQLANSPKLRIAFGQGAKSAAANFTYQSIGSYRARAFRALLRRDPLPARLEMAKLEAGMAS